MKESSFQRKTIRGQRLIVLLTVILVSAGVPLLACAFARSQPSVDVTIVNNTSWRFNHVYFSSVVGNDWGPDQLNDLVIPQGGSRTLSVTCGSGDKKVIIEDSEGCFFYRVISCSENTTWTVTNNDTRDCGN